jgi:hypothetical protein
VFIRASMSKTGGSSGVSGGVYFDSNELFGTSARSRWTWHRKRKHVPRLGPAKEGATTGYGRVTFVTFAA